VSRGERRAAAAVGGSVPNGLPPLVEAKLLAPRLRARLVERPRVTDLLDGTGGAALTLLSAPTGYGKTTAVRAWCEDRGDASAWITLDPGDNDPVRLWTYVATAVNRIRDGLGRGALQRLDRPGACLEFAIDELANGIGAFDEPLVVVLDELHLIDDPRALVSLEHFIERLPPNGRLVVLTRSEPALELPRRRALGALVELRAAELAFTLAEARELLVDRARIPLRATEVGELVARTEGWPAGLCLAALWLRGLDDPTAGARAFAGSNRNVVSYLSREVLDGLDCDTRSFLLRSAVLGRFTTELCDAALGRSDSAAMLERIERRNLFLVPLDGVGRWFRYHALFAELLALELGTDDPEVAPGLHRRASAWFEQRGLLVEAADHATLAGDHAFVADLLVRYQRSLHVRPTTFLRLVETLPEQALIERPVLPVMAAVQAGHAGRPARDRRRFLSVAARARAEHPDRFGPALHAAVGLARVGWIDRDLAKAIRFGRRAAAIASADDEAGALFVDVTAALSHALCVAGDLDGASQSAWAAIEHPGLEDRPSSYAVALSALALAAVGQGRVTAARAHVDAAAAVVHRAGLDADCAGGIAAGASAVVHRAEGNLPEAELRAERAEHIRRRQGACVELAWTLLLLAEIRRLRGRLADAGRTLVEARDVLGELADAGPLDEWLAEEGRQLAEALEQAATGDRPELPTEAELAVLRLMPSDFSLRQIAGELFLSQNTVKTHTRVIYRKLGVGSRAEAVARADALGLLVGESPGVNEAAQRPADPGSVRLAVCPNARIASSSRASSTTTSRARSTA
jgi:ATP/maltotriose-dependent transcriptional regulator MalT